MTTGAAGRGLLLALALLGGTASHAQIAIPSGTGDQMLAGMMGMMSKFANQFQNAQGGSMSGGIGSMPMSAVQSAANPMAGGMMPMSPSMTPSMMAPMSGLVSQFGQGQGLAPAGNAALSSMKGASLDGAWRGQNGEILLIEAQRFRLHADQRRYLDGRLGRRDNIVGFLYPQSNTALLYHYQISGDKLALRDRQQRTRYFQRIPMNR